MLEILEDWINILRRNRRPLPVFTEIAYYYSRKHRSASTYPRIRVRRLPIYKRHDIVIVIIFCSRPFCFVFVTDADDVILSDISILHFLRKLAANKRLRFCSLDITRSWEGFWERNVTYMMSFLFPTNGNLDNFIFIFQKMFKVIIWVKHYFIFLFSPFYSLASKLISVGIWCCRCCWCIFVWFS